MKIITVQCDWCKTNREWNDSFFQVIRLRKTLADGETVSSTNDYKYFCDEKCLLDFYLKMRAKSKNLI